MIVNFDNPGDGNNREKEYDFSKGCILKANQDMPFLGVSKDDTLKVVFDGQYLRVGPLSWSPEALTEEINQKVWTLEEIL